MEEEKKPQDKKQIDDFELILKIGEGAFGYVYIAKSKQTQ